MKRLFLYSFILLLVLMIPASAVYLQVENGTTEQFRNDTAVSNIGNPYVNATRINFTEDVYGWVNFSVNNRYSDGASDCFKIMKNGVMIGSEYCNTGWDWHFINQSIYGKYNSTDVIWYQRVDNIGSTGSIKGAVMSYTKTNVVITSPENNSAQTSKALNVTWSSSISTVRVQASTQGDFGTLLWNATTTNGYYNATVSTGLIYVRARGEDAANSSETNWSAANQYLIYDSSELKGGYGYNYTSAGWIFDNTFMDFSSNDISGGGIWGIDFEDNRMPNWTVGSTAGANWVVQNGFLSQENTTATDNHYHFNTSNFSDYDILTSMLYKAPGTPVGIFGLDTRVQFWSNLSGASSERKGYENYARRGAGKIRILENYPGSSSVFRNESLFQVYSNSSYFFRLNLNGSIFSAKIWNTTEPDWMMITSNTTNYSTGKIGVIDHVAASSFDYIWIRNLSGSTFLKNGTATSEIITLGYNKSVSGFSINSSIPPNNIISIEVRSSSDNITWNDWISMGTLLNQSNILLNSSYANQYAQVRFTMNNTDYAYPKIYNFSVLSTNTSKISGYVNHANGSAMDNASVIYAIGIGKNYSTYTTNSTGYYEFRALPRSQIVLVAGKTGFDANGTLIRNITVDSNIEHNFSLNVSVPVPPNIMANESQEIFNRFSQYINETGHLTSTEGYDDNYFGMAEFNVQQIGPYLYSSGQNRTINHTELTLRWLVHSADVLYSGACNHEKPDGTFLDANSWNGTIYDYVDHRCMRQSFYYYGVAKGIYNIYPYIDLNTKDYLNQTLSESVYNGNGTQNINQLLFKYGSANSSAINSTYATSDFWSDVDFTMGTNYNFLELVVPNSAFNSMIPYQISKTLGHSINQTYIDNIFDKFTWMVNNDGFIRYSEAKPSSLYYCAMSKMSFEMITYGYNPPQNVYDAINKSADWCERLEIQSGEGFPMFRSTGTPVEDLIHAEQAVLREATGSRYRRLDLSMSKTLQSKWQVGAYYGAKNYFDPTDEVGYSGYNNFVDNNILIGAQFALIGKYYDSSKVETNSNYTNNDDYNSSGLMILNSGDKSVALLKNVSVTNAYTGQGKGFFPMRFVPVVEHQDYYTIYPNVNINETCCNYTDLFIKLNGSRINTSKINYVPVTHAFTNNSLWINYTGLGFMDGATEKIIYYYNLSVVENSGILHMKYEIGYDPVTFNIQNYSDGIDFATNDNRTIAVITNTSNGILYVRGNNTINITDITVTNGVLSGINNNSGIWGKGQFGYNNRTLINSSVTGSPFIIEYDMNITTTNVYGYMLNNPPGVFTTSPDTPLNTGLGSQTFDIEFTQSLDNISWDINGTIKEWDNGTSTGSYTNSTAGTGIYNVTATGCNAQGCASFSWIWTVDGTAPASVTNVVAVSNTTHFNMSWVNPVDADFSYTYWLNGSTWAGNLTNNSLNISGGSHEVKNYSAQTVDALGNMNGTKVWFNGTIQNQPITLSGVSSSYSIASGATLAIDAGYSDPDGDTGTFQDNSTLWNIDTSTGVVSWVGVEGDYDWQIGVSDGYGSIAYQNFTVSVSTQILYPNPVTGCSAVLGYYYANVSCSAVQP